MTNIIQTNHRTYTQRKVKTMARKTFQVTCKEEGRGRASSKLFGTLAEARDYIRDRWQGVEYIDGPASFHADYCTYKCVGFALADIGKRRWCEDWFEWDWLPLDGENVEVGEQFDDIGYPINATATETTDEAPF